MVSPAKARAVLGARGSLFDHAFASESASAVLAAVALPLFLLSAAQELEQDAAMTHVVPDIAVDGLMADPEAAFQPEAPGDLIRTPEQLQT